MRLSLKFFNPYKSTPNEEALLSILHTALKYVKKTCLIGTGNKMEDNERTHGFSAFCCNRSNQGHYQKKSMIHPTSQDERDNEVYDPDTKRFVSGIKHRQWYYHTTQDGSELPIICFNADHPCYPPNFDSKLINLLSSSLYIQTIRAGNCQAQSNLLAKYLWENHTGIDKIEVVEASNFDHSFVIINRKGELNDSTTWGNAWIVDPWYGEKGIIYSASQFKNQILVIKNYILEQIKKLSDAGVLFEPSDIPTDEETYCYPAVEIKPKEQPYPTLSTNPFYPF